MKNGGAFRSMSNTDANDDVITILEMFESGLAAAPRIDRTPLIAGITSSFSLFFVSYVKGCDVLDYMLIMCISMFPVNIHSQHE